MEGNYSLRFQYRRRYGLHAIWSVDSLQMPASRFNTASGMDCMQFYLIMEAIGADTVSIPQAVWIACN